MNGSPTPVLFPFNSFFAGEDVDHFQKSSLNLLQHCFRSAPWALGPERQGSTSSHPAPPHWRCRPLVRQDVPKVNVVTATTDPPSQENCWLDFRSVLDLNSHRQVFLMRLSPRRNPCFRPLCSLISFKIKINLREQYSNSVKSQH